MVTPAKDSRVRPAYAIKSVDHALRLAAQLQLEGRLTLSDAAARLDVAPSTAHRLLSMLVYRDFAAKDGREYRVGPLLETAAHSHSMTARLRAAALPAMRQLTDRFDETTTLMLRSGRTTRFIADVESSQALRVGARAGMVFPAHRTSGGLVLLAALPDEEIRELYDPNRVPAGEEVPDVESVLRHVASVRDRGFAVNHGFAEKGILGIGHAIGVSPGSPLAALAVAMPSARFEPALLHPMVAALRRAVGSVEAALRDAAVSARSGSN